MTARRIKPIENRCVHRLVEQLPPIYREILVLRDIEELTFREIAEILAIPIGTVMTRLALGHLRLRSALAQQGSGQRDR
jgi:RNA polymerase sigma-70 factor (ECF subfamily)